MGEDSTTKTTVRIDEEYAEKLEAQYPSATSLPQALLAASQDGVDFRSAIENDLETFVRELVRDELDGYDRGVTSIGADD